MEMESLEQNALACNRLQHHQEKGLKPCPKCHPQAFETHGQKALFEVLNGSKEGRDYVYTFVAERNRNLGQICSRKLNASLIYENTRMQLRHCKCVDDKTC